MKISRVEAIPIRQELKEPFGNAQGWTTARQYLIVRVTADDGTTGYGECWGPIAGNREIVRDVIAPSSWGQAPWTRRSSGRRSISASGGPITPLPPIPP